MTVFSFYISVSCQDGRKRTLEEICRRLDASGCDFTSVSFEDGETIIDFDREAESFAAATATVSPLMSLAGLTVLRISPVEVAEATIAGIGLCNEDRSCADLAEQESSSRQSGNKESGP